MMANVTGRRTMAFELKCSKTTIICQLTWPGSQMKSIAISQSNYIPWKGYFDMIAYVDEFVLYDDVQYTRRDWRNRNKIKTPLGTQWLTVPVQVKGKFEQTIRNTKLQGEEWAVSHWRTLNHNYAKAPFFSEVAIWLEPIYLQEGFVTISELNRRLIEAICAYLSIDTVISNSWDYKLLGGKSERLAGICEQAGAARYISGPAAKSYMELQPFNVHKIEVDWYNYEGYPEYQQLWEGFEHGVSILDVLFNCGADSRKCLRHTT